MSQQSSTVTISVAELETLRKKAAKLDENQRIRFKVSEKGAVSIYGLNSRFPVTLYRSQWERVLADADNLRAFIAANAASLKTKE